MFGGSVDVDAFEIWFATLKISRDRAAAARSQGQHRRFGGTVRALMQTPSGRDRVPELLWIFAVVGRFPWVPGRLSYLRGLFLGSVFLWRLFVDPNIPVLWPGAFTL